MTAPQNPMSLAKRAMKTIWGYDQFRPNQEEAIQTVVNGEDSLTVLPTGGGKSLIFQLPITLVDGMAVVVSPLIALMQDQVHSLQLLGIPTACLTSLQGEKDIRRVKAQMFRGELKLLYVSPERLLMPHFLDELKTLNIQYFAVDEAHCISQWGHDFRPEYTRLNQIRTQFAGVPIHAFTATASPTIQTEVCNQLDLNNPRIILGSYFRPNLHYKVFQRHSIRNQLLQEVRRHESHQCGIIYCLTRRETEAISNYLQEKGYRALPYHAGLSADERQRNQQLFTNEDIQIMVATVAFGMGIDQSNIRFVIHLGLPKSLSHYQQESGRAGRDGLKADCTLFYGGKDIVFWKRMIEEENNQENRLIHLNAMIRYATSLECRHAQLCGHFGQNLPGENCEACDVCKGEIASIPDVLPTAKKILSAVYRVGQAFGSNYVAQILTGSTDKKILGNGHHSLSVHGLLKHETQKQVQDWIGQLESQKFLERQGHPYPILRITGKGFHLLNPAKFGLEKLSVSVVLVKTDVNKAAAKAVTPAGDFDHALFEELRTMRALLAKKAGLPPFMVFGDRTLQDLAAKKPRNSSDLLKVFGIGQFKVKKFGKTVLKQIEAFESKEATTGKVTENTEG